MRGICIFSSLALSPLGSEGVDSDVFLVHYAGWLNLIFLPDSISLNWLVKVLEAFTYVVVCCIL